MLREVAMNRFLSSAAVLSVYLPVAALAETVAEQNELSLPGDEAGTAMPSDGLAECAAILAAAASKSTNIVYRGNMKNSSAAWFAASGDLAVAEGGALPEGDTWAAKVTEWSERIASVDAMAQHRDWMVYCTELGKAQQLDISEFSLAADTASAPEAETN